MEYKRKWNEKNLYYAGNPNDYARIVFRRYGRDGSYPVKRGHTLLIALFLIGFLFYF
jgi:hypothetical protein